MNEHAGVVGYTIWDVLTSAGVREAVLADPIATGLILATLGVFATDFLFGAPYALYRLTVRSSGLHRRVAARRAVLRMREEGSRQFSVLVAPFEEDSGGALAAVVDHALSEHLSAFLFDREVGVARPPVIMSGVDGEEVARQWSERSDADLVLWGNGARRGLMRLYFLTADARDAATPIQEIRLVPPDLPAERDRLAAGVAYVLARSCLPTADNADAYRTEKLEPVLQALDKLSSEPPHGLGSKFERLLREDAAKIAFSVGRRDQDGSALRRASRLRVRLLSEISRAEEPEAWAKARAESGRSQLALGLTEGDPRRLDSAIEAFGEAAEMLKGEELRANRAIALLDLGRAHAARAEDGHEVSHLTLAAKAYRMAVTVAPEHFDRRRIVDGQRGLASALHNLADAQQDADGLRRAIDVYRQAAHDETRALDPESWARGQYELGRALISLAAMDGGPEHYRDAMVAFQASLDERTREADEEMWAETMSQLGHAAYQFGRMEAGAAGLEGAIAAYQDALDARSPDKDPLAWAQTKNNLGNALQALGERTGERWRLELAVREYRAALQVFTQRDHPGEWAGTQNNLGNALHVIGEKGDSVEALREALIAHASALKVRTRAANQVDWAATRNNIGLVLTTLGSRLNDRDHLREAIDAYRDALGVFRQAGATKYAVTAERNLRHAETMLAQTRRAAE